MRPSASILRRLLVSLLVALPATARADARERKLLAHGSDERFWLARYGNFLPNHADGPAQAFFYVRGPGDLTFARFPLQSGPVASIADRGTQLGVLMKGGTWIMASESSTLSEGPPLPANARMIDLAGGDDTFWAIGSAALVPPPTTTSSDSNSSQPTTTTALAALPTSVPTTSPATTQPTFVPPSLYKLEEGVWNPIAPLAPRSALSAVKPSLSIIDHTPYLAFSNGARGVRIVRLEGSTWNTVAILSGDAAVTEARLLRGTAMPVVWISRQNQADTLDFLSGSGPPAHVVLSFVPASAKDLAVAYALGRIRVLFGDGNSLSEQDLDVPAGVLSGKVTTVAFVTDAAAYRLVRAMQYIIWTALFLAILGAVRFRRRMQGMVFDLEKMHIAPLGTRAGAGAIDFIPLVVGIAICEGRMTDQARELVLTASLSLYVLHTAVTEMIAGRSLGKWVMGLRVVSLTGGRPSIWSLLLRNLLRVIDVGLFFVPLIVVVLSPLRQRTGDVAAGTLVVTAERA